MKFECARCEKKCKAETDFKPKMCLEDGSNAYYGWKEVAAPAPKPLSSILPKLTAEVFDREDCPKDAKIATVDADGNLAFGNFESARVSPYVGIWEGKYNGQWTEIKGIKFDASDWQNSLIHRPEKKNLVDWSIYWKKQEPKLPKITTVNQFYNIVIEVKSNCGVLEAEVGK